MATPSAPASLTPDPGRPKTEDPGPLRAAHTPNFPALLRQLGASLLVTTYQAGKLVMVRDEGDHLNTHFRTFKAPMGLALADGGAKFATALGEANEMGGWRPNKARGGLLMDVDSGAILCRGLSMPHSPRWYGGRLWVCESGSGTLGYVDRNTGRYEAVAAVPGFTRGLDLPGDPAFLRLAQVRQPAGVR